MKSSFARYIRKYPLKHFEKGQIIFVQDVEPTCVYVIKQGIVKVYNLTADGDEKPISYDMPGEFLPIGWTFGKLQATQYYYEAFIDTDVYCIPREEYISFLKQNPDVLYQAFEYFVSRYMNFQMRINALAQSKASSKVLHTIHFLALRFGADVKKHTVKILLPLTQQELANFMGLTRETTSIELKKLQDQKILSYRQQKYTVHTNRLNELLDEEYDQGQLKPERKSLID